MKSFEDYLAEQSMIAEETRRAERRSAIYRNRTREERRRHRRMVATITGAALAAVVFIAACSCVRGVTAPEEESRPVPMEPMPSPSGYPIVPIPEKVLARMAEPTVTPMPTPEPAPAYTEEELEMMALVIYQEAGGDAASDECRQMVGEVVLNRVADNRFPDTIEEVLLQKRQYGRLSETGLVWPARAENPGEAHAVERAYACAEDLLSGTVERLLPEDAIWQAEFKQGNEVLAYDSGLYFCR